MQTQNVPAQLTVLTPQLGERLAAVNAATRELRAMGITVISQDLRSERPKLQLSAGCDALLKKLQNPLLLKSEGMKFQTGTFGAVDVCWVHPKPAATPRAASH